MNLLDLLLELEIPAWIVLSLSLIGIVGMVYYKYRIGKKLLKDAVNWDLVKLVIIKRHEALLEVNYNFREFDHSIDHLLKGDSDYETHLQDFREKSRKLARKNATLIGDRFYDAVVNATDIGSRILRARLTLPKEAFEKLKNTDLRDEQLGALKKAFEKSAPITHPDALTEGLDEKTVRRLEALIDIDYNSYYVSSREFDKDKYDRAKALIRELTDELDDIIRKLPRLD